MDNKIVSYDVEKIQAILNLINQVPTQGIQQAQMIVQIATVLSNPIKEKDNKTEE
jgi:hypothetical protein